MNRNLSINPFYPARVAKPPRNSDWSSSLLLGRWRIRRGRRSGSQGEADRRNAQQGLLVVTALRAGFPPARFAWLT